jgi:Kef-type K+ transport system membrane component KefB
LQLLALGWRFLIALLSHALGLSYEIGAFVAGVALTRSPISYFLSEQLKQD